MLNFYYKRICHLRIAQPLIKDITILHNTLLSNSRRLVIDAISYVVLKYDSELDKIAFYMTGRPVVRGDKESLFKDYTQINLEEDIEYLINCLIIIGAVRYGVEKSIESAIMRITEFEE